MAAFIAIASVGGKARGSPFSAALELYAERLAGYGRVEFPVYDAEDSLLTGCARWKGRVAPLLVLLDSRGKGYSSEAFAEWLRTERDSGRQAIFFGIGPANGWSEAARARADLLLSLGPMTLAHELARVVLAEQVYRAFTIMAGHPYHAGH